MKTLTQRLILGAAVAGVLATTATAWAFGGDKSACEGRGDHGPRAERMQEKMQQRLAERQTQLKTALKLTPAQEKDWQAFSAAMQPAQAKSPRLDRDAWAQLTTPQRMEKMQALRAERERSMDQRLAAVKQFYATLTPEQQKVFDQQHHRMGRHGNHGGHSPMHG